MRNVESSPGGVLLSIVMIVLGSCGIALAQQRPVLHITLEDAQARAAKASHRLAEARAREAAAQAAVSLQQVSDRPMVTASAGYSRTNHVLEFVVPSPTGVPRVLYPDVPNNYRTRLDLQWPIYSGGRTDALERAARAEASAVSADVAAAQGDLRLEVARAFWAVVTARATVSVLQQGLARSQAHVADVRQRLDVGLVPPNEVASAEAQEARQRMLLIEAENQQEIASADLGRLIEVEPAQAIEPEATLERAPLPPMPIDTLIAGARASRSELRALERRVEGAQNREAAAAANRRPTVAVVGGVDFARPNPRIFPRADRWDESWEAGFNMSWSLWDGGRSAADIAQAASLTEAARQRLAEFDSVLGLEVRQRALEIGSGQAAVIAATEGVRAATEAQRVVTERYRAGVITQIEVLDAQFALLQAELDLTRARAGVRLSEARLLRAVGP